MRTEIVDSGAGGPELVLKPENHGDELLIAALVDCARIALVGHEVVFDGFQMRKLRLCLSRRTNSDQGGPKT